MITLFRIDERLIHGQVAYAWTQAYKSDAILVIDDEVVKDSMQVNLLKLACPPTMKCFVCDTNKAVALLKKYPNKKFFVVAKHPKYALELRDNGIPLQHLNVGGMYFKEGRQEVTKTVYLDDETREMLKRLHEEGVALDGRTTARDSELDLSTLL